MEDVGVVERAGRYAYASLPNGRQRDPAAGLPLALRVQQGGGRPVHGDYARIYGLPTVTLRQSAIYGPRQLGVEDQGWVAWFCIAATLGRPITVYGDGMQVRDVLWVDDLLDAYDLAIEFVGRVKGQVFNVGGGPGQHPVHARGDRGTWNSAWGDPSILASRSGARAISGSSWRTSARPGGSWGGSAGWPPARGSTACWTG